MERIKIIILRLLKIKTTHTMLKDKKDGMYEIKVFVIKKDGKCYDYQPIIKEVKNKWLGVNTIKTYKIPTKESEL